MGTPAYAAIVKVGGTSTAFIQQNASRVDTSNDFQIDDSIYRVLDTDVAITLYTSEGTPVEITGNPIDSVDYLTGTITLTQAASDALPSGFEDDILVSANYIPLATVGGAMSYTLDIGGDVLESTDFDSGGYRERKYGLHDIAVSISRYDALDSIFTDIKTGREKAFIEIRPGGGDEVARGWFVIETDSKSGDVSALEQEELSFNLYGEADATFSYVDES